MERKDIAQMNEYAGLVSKKGFPETLGDFVRFCAQEYKEQIVGYWFDISEQLTYKQLNEQSDRLASSLIKLGVRKGTHVAVMVNNDPVYLISWVALGKIGAVIVPINTAYRKKDLEFVLTDSDAQFFILDKEYLPLYQYISSNLTLINDERIIVTGGDTTFLSWEQLLVNGNKHFHPPSLIKKTDPLNIQYTSGTTGFPKGCILTHDYWILIMRFASAPLLSLGGVRRVLVWQPFYYMDGMWLFLTAMCLGGTAYVAKRMQLKKFHDWVAQYRIQYCIYPEPALKTIEHKSEKNNSLRYVSIYGWSKQSRLDFQKYYPNVVARESYGMTEIGLGLLVPTVAQEKALQLTCGIPGPFREFKIVNDSGLEVGVGEEGELWVSGRSILNGYYKKPKDNAQSFQGKWFKTGDIFYKDEFNYFYLIGRSKDMIIRSGENISAREVEATINQIHAVAETAVTAVADPIRREEVKAFILLKDGFTPDMCPPIDIINFCHERLAHFKVPRYICYVKSFPRTPSRKIRKPQLVEQPDIFVITETYDHQAETTKRTAL